jgi:phosphoribosylanthranilate isomerase
MNFSQSMRKTRIKICGIRRVEDAMHAAYAGADAIGLNFYAPSPRAVTLQQAMAVRDALPPFVSTVALFVNASRSEVINVCDSLNPSLLQFHGDEDHDYCASFSRPYLKAIRVGTAMKADDLVQLHVEFSTAMALLLDTLSAGQYGGTGESFNWDVIPVSLREKIILSGGLTPLNVDGAVRKIKPWAVDVSSGVEIEKGISDPKKILAFMSAVQRADAELYKE